MVQPTQDNTVAISSPHVYAPVPVIDPFANVDHTAPYQTLEELDRDLHYITSRVQATTQAGQIDLSHFQQQLDSLKRYNAEVSQARERVMEKSMKVMAEQSGEILPLIGNAEKIAINGKNYIWGINKIGQLFRYENSEWKFIYTENHLFKDISVTKNRIDDNLFCISQTGHIYRYNPNIAVPPTEEYPTSGQWCLEPMLDPSFYNEHKFTSIAAMSRRRIFATTEDGTVMFFKLPHRFSFSIYLKSSQVLGQGRMRKVFVGASHTLHREEIMGIGLDNRAYRYDKDKSEWVGVDVLLRDMCITRGNIVLAVMLNGDIQKWTNRSTFEPVQPKSVTFDLNGGPQDMPDSYFLNSICAFDDETVYGVEGLTRRIVKISL
jgi:hypothetical protein